jgi:proprotein convertase subtilisin/kexin type 5
MDGGAVVSLAEQWTNVPPQHICKSREVIEEKYVLLIAINLYISILAE